MAAIVPTLRGAIRSSRQFYSHGNIRRLHNSTRLCAAQNFTMPAMSPTMTEGNIASWKVKEGDSYSAGDVLLEIETDKAQMDVEAQEDGILAKIIQPDGSKAVKVGTRIAVCAEPGDDLSSLEMPADEPAKSSSSTKENKKSDPPTASPPKQESQPADGAQDSSSTSSPASNDTKTSTSRSYPLYPSVIQLLHTNGISESDASKIPTTGPGGRLLKGDVLAYMGSIDKSYPKEQSEMLGKLAKLDLSNINISKKDPSGGKAAPADQKSAQESKAEQPIAEPTAEIAVTISLSTVTELQQRISKTLGIDIPLSEFIARAVAVANTDLPRRNRAPTADELFDQVLGFDKVPGTQHGSFNPRILSMPPLQMFGTTRQASESDIIDILTGKATKRGPTIQRTLTAPSGGAAQVFTLSVPKEDERRAKVFLERMKTTLQVDPGRLVL